MADVIKASVCAKQAGVESVVICYRAIPGVQNMASARMAHAFVHKAGMDVIVLYVRYTCNILHLITFV